MLLRRDRGSLSLINIVMMLLCFSLAYREPSCRHQDTAKISKGASRCVVLCDYNYSSIISSSPGGPGVYTVVQCGSAGHNLRSRPNMRGTPVGRLTKGSSVNIVEEVSHCQDLKKHISCYCLCLQCVSVF